MINLDRDSAYEWVYNEPKEKGLVCHSQKNMHAFIKHFESIV